MDDLEDCLNQVYRMALAAMQSYAFWLRTLPDDSPHEEVLKRYGHFFYATNEAHLTTVFISLDALYDDKESLLNFTRLLALTKPKLTAADYDPLESKIEALRKLAKGLRIIRNNSFGHVAQYATRMRQGEKHNLSQGEYLALCYNSLEVATKIARLLGNEMASAQEINAKDLEHIDALLSALECGDSQS